MHVSKPFTWGMVTLLNSGDEPVVIDSVKLLAPTPGLKVTGVYGVDKGGRETFSRVDPQTTFGSRLHPIKGYTVPGPVDGQYTIAIGLTTARVGAYTVSAVDVSYHVGNISYVWRARELLTVCARPPAVSATKFCQARFVGE